MPKGTPPLAEPLDGQYSRVHLSCLNEGLTAETLSKLFCASAKKEPGGKEKLQSMLDTAIDMVDSGELPLDKALFTEELYRWSESGYNTVRHSEIFREAYRPAYRVVAKRYADFLRIFTEIDKLLTEGKVPLTVVIEGGSASGKTTLAETLATVYDCNVIHMDDFFLRPEQRTSQRLGELGGNIDRERFTEEIIVPLQKNECIQYRPFDCSVQALGETVTLPQKNLTIVEGAYSMHTAFGRYYGLAFFLDIAPEYQRERILKRNSPNFAKRFFEEWIPLENKYFIGTDTRHRASTVIPIV